MTKDLLQLQSRYEQACRNISAFGRESLQIANTWEVRLMLGDASVSDPTRALIEDRFLVHLDLIAEKALLVQKIRETREQLSKTDFI